LKISFLSDWWQMSSGLVNMIGRCLPSGFWLVSFLSGLFRQ